MSELVAVSKYIKVDETSPKPSDVEVLPAGDLTIMALNRRGKSHENGISQDAYKILTLEDGTVIVTLADGLGDEQCPSSAEGAKIATRVGGQFIADNIESVAKKFLSAKPSQRAKFLAGQDIIKGITKEWQAAIQEITQSDYPNYIEFATTLMVSILSPGTIDIIMLGHNHAYSANPHGQFGELQIGKPVNSNKTVNMATPNKHAHIGLYASGRPDPFQPLLLTSDGFSKLTLHNESLLGKVMSSHDPASFSSLLKPSDDDLTAILIQQSKTS